MEISMVPSNNIKGRNNSSKNFKVHNKPTATISMPKIKGSTSQDDLKMGIEYLSKVLHHYESSKNIVSKS
jgi:hypothetical protein